MNSAPLCVVALEPCQKIPPNICKGQIFPGFYELVSPEIIVQIYPKNFLPSLSIYFSANLFWIFIRNQSKICAKFLHLTDKNISPGFFHTLHLYLKDCFFRNVFRNSATDSRNNFLRYFPRIPSQKQIGFTLEHIANRKVRQKIRIQCTNFTIFDIYSGRIQQKLLRVLIGNPSGISLESKLLK